MRGEKCRGLPIAAEWNSKWRITGTGGSARWGGGPIISSRCIIRSRLQSALDRAIWKFHLSFRAGVLRRCSDTFSLNRGLVSSRLVSPRRPNAFAALSAITRHQRIPPTYPVRVEIIQSRILGVEINRHFWRFRTSLSLLSLSFEKKGWNR